MVLNATDGPLFATASVPSERALRETPAHVESSSRRASLAPGRMLRFVRAGSVLPSLVGGWDVVSARGRWGDDGGVTIVFRVPASGAERVGFSYSPSLEAVLSLHVLVEPKHHPVQHGWVRAMRGLAPALKREIDVFAFAFRAYFPEFFLSQAGFDGGLDSRILSSGEETLRRHGPSKEVPARAA